MTKTAAATMVLLGVGMVDAQLPPIQGEWQFKNEMYFENRETGMQVYYSPELYVEFDPDNKNYREYTYNDLYGKDYMWKNYDKSIYSEREFIARYDQLTYYTDQNDELRDWGQQAGFAAAMAGSCCVALSICIICTSCCLSRRKRKRELKRQKELSEMEGVDVNTDESNEKGDTSDNATKDPDVKQSKDKKSKKKNDKKSTKEKKKAALKKLEQESKEPTVVADISDDNADGSRRDMLPDNSQFTVSPVDETTTKKVGDKRFDLEDGGEADLPQGNEKGGGYF